MIHLTDKRVAIPAGGIALILALYFVSGLFGKTDDWKYTHTSAEQWLMYAAIAVGAIILSWLIISIYLIVKGRPDDRGNNARRKLGVWLLVAPIVILGIGFGVLATGFGVVIVVLPLLILVLVVLGIMYAIKHQAKIALFPLILIPLLLCGGVFFVVISSSTASIQFSSGIAESRNLGFSVGGAKDIDNFRQNVEEGYLPLPTDITYEGIYYDYFFDTGETQTCDKLFCPSYSYALSKDPLSNDEEYYLQVGLNSGIQETDFQRKKLNLVIVLDISGSMSSSFNTYYYDQSNTVDLSGEQEDEDAGKSKMEIASKAVVGLLDHLNADDRFGMVLFDDKDYLGKPLNEVRRTDMDAIKGHILELSPRGGTNFEAGYVGATKLFDDFMDADSAEYENRIIFLTDAMPNRGSLDEDGLLGMTQNNSENSIYTTFIGIGVDFNTELIEHITKIRGANYYSVHSAKEFKTRMDDEFEYMVTPLVFNLLLELDAPGFEIEKVYGSPEANEATGEIMKVNTLFPSKRADGQTKGGIVILKLNKIGDDDSLQLTTSYEDRVGDIDGDEIDLDFPSVTADHYDNTGIRKGILLARYVNVMRNWIDDQRESYQQEEPVAPVMNYDTGIIVPPDPRPPELGRWERQSMPLTVSEEYELMVSEFKTYFEIESQAIGDPTLSQEVDMMEQIIN